jgi:hypothetical protein
MKFNLFQTLTSYLITIYFNIIFIQICTYILQILLQQTEYDVIFLVFHYMYITQNYFRINF